MTDKILTPQVVCFEPDGVTPCRFAPDCHESRQRLQAGWTKASRGWVPTGRKPLRGRACWAYNRKSGGDPFLDPDAE